jgi:hypothetical protein
LNVLLLVLNKKIDFGSCVCCADFVLDLEQWLRSLTQQLDFRLSDFPISFSSFPISVVDGGCLSCFPISIFHSLFRFCVVNFRGRDFLFPGPVKLSHESSPPPGDFLFHVSSPIWSLLGLRCVDFDIKVFVLLSECFFARGFDLCTRCAEHSANLDF